MTAPSLAQTRADFHEIGQLSVLSFKLKQWIKLIDGIVTIDYVSNLNSYNILLRVESIKQSSSSSSYCYQMTPPFEIQQKDKKHQSQYMLKAKDLSTNEPTLLAIIFKKVSIANQFYNFIVEYHIHTLLLILHTLFQQQ